MSTDASLHGLSTRRRGSVLRRESGANAPALLVLASRANARTAVVSPDWTAGYEAGLAAERAASADELDAVRAELGAARMRVDHLALVLADAAEDLRSRQAIAVEDLGTSLVDAALEIATAVLGQEISSGRAAPVVLERALALLPASGPAEIRLHPEDIAVMKPLDRPSIELVPDDTVERGGCVIDFADGSIDAQLGPALDRVRQILLDDIEESW